MPTILEVITKTTPFFEKTGVESPRLTIELLLAHVLQTRRLQLYLDFEKEIDAAPLTRLRALVGRRAKGEPLQYLTGSAEFHGREFTVDRRVLIPRPETELLVATVLERLKPGDRRLKTEDGSRRSPLTLVDVGTGSGCIAVTLAKELPQATVYALDISADALAVAQVNATRHQAEKNIRFLESDLLSSLPDSLTVDAIVSNPPYVASGDLAGLPKEVRDFEPVTALAAGEDGLKVFQRLVTDAQRVLSSNGWLALELGAGQCLAVTGLLKNNGFAVDRVVKDLQDHERVIIARVS